jgi:hypothetical protein
VASGAGGDVRRLGSPRISAGARRACRPSVGAFCVLRGKQDVLGHFLSDMDHESDQADRAISTGKLNASPRLHTQPINVVVFHGPDREYSFRGGFPA